MAPKLWDAVRYSVDKKESEGLYILIGLTTVDKTKIMYSGTGRIHRMKMLPMSLYESGESNGKISLNLYLKHCIRDLRVYSSDMGGNILYYNDGTLEADCIVQLRNEDYGLIEIKLGSAEIKKRC